MAGLKCVTGIRDDRLMSLFWSGSFKERRCLVPVTSFAEPKGSKPAIWHSFALGKDRSLFAIAGIWRIYKGPIRKEGQPLELDVYSFMTTTPNEFVATIHPKRMLVLLTTPEDFDCWPSGTPDEARQLVLTYPADGMEISKRQRTKRTRAEWLKYAEIVIVAYRMLAEIKK